MEGFLEEITDVYLPYSSENGSFSQSSSFDGPGKFLLQILPKVSSPLIWNQYFLISEYLYI